MLSGEEVLPSVKDKPPVLPAAIAPALEPSPVLSMPPLPQDTDLSAGEGKLPHVWIPYKVVRGAEVRQQQAHDIVLGFKQVERELGIKSNSYITRLDFKLKVRGEAAFVLATKVVEFGTDILRENEHPGNATVVAAHEALHAFFEKYLANGKDGGHWNRFFKESLSSIEFCGEIAEGAFSRDVRPAAGHPWDNASEMFASFVNTLLAPANLWRGNIEKWRQTGKTNFVDRYKKGLDALRKGLLACGDVPGGTQIYHTIVNAEEEIRSMETTASSLPPLRPPQRTSQPQRRNQRSRTY